MSPESTVSVPYLIRPKYGLLHGVHKYVDLRGSCVVRTSCTMSLRDCSHPVHVLLGLEPFLLTLFDAFEVVWFRWG